MAKCKTIHFPSKNFEECLQYYIISAFFWLWHIGKTLSSFRFDVEKLLYLVSRNSLFVMALYNPPIFTPLCVSYKCLIVNT